jgi:hypothetical protein
MGGPGAPDSLADAPLTQVWLASSMEQQALQSGRYFYHKKIQATHPDARNQEIQDRFIEKCREISGISLPA